MQDDDADCQQVVVISVAGVTHEQGIDLLRNDQDDADAANRRRAKGDEQRLAGNKVGRSQDDLAPGCVDCREQQRLDVAGRSLRPGRKDLHLAIAGERQRRCLRRREIAAGLQEGQRQRHRFECPGGRALDPDHGIDPFADAGVLLEKSWIGDVHAASVGEAAVDDGNLAVIAQVETDEQHTQGIDRQDFDDLDTGSAQSFDRCTAEKGTAT
ncbi:MAG: hypothetical protein AW09_004528 [Candidatus Accumulibacter phosphatis]|uniref:Uncharacterized protein n=1 Tax=Candidatus Accumulibacter phosphatis TaxID=327160 RepID=A0A084Y6K9_9PROT|nr:MAG: hypothetical protein AW09_004528 [Candidatus Accumulibacter phosphatis]